MYRVTVLGCIAGAIVLASISSRAWAQSWPLYQGDPGHTGYVAVSLNPDDFELRWQRTIRNDYDLNPATAADGRVFVSEVTYFNDGGLWVLDSATGEPLWNVTYGSVFSVNPPSYAFGQVYIQTGNHSSDTYLRAYDADTGSEVFTAPHAAQWEQYFAPTVHPDGTVYVNGGYYGGMYAFDALDGTQLWFHDLPQYDEWTPAVDDTRAYSYVGEYAPGLYVFDRFTGEQEYMIPDDGFDWNGWSMQLAPVLGRQDNALAIHDGRLISFDLSDQSIGWQLDKDFSGQPSLANGAIYAIDAGALTVLDEATGASSWSWEAPAGLIGAIIVTDSHALATTDSAVYAVDLTTHEAVWSFDASGHLALDISDGVLIIAGDNGLLTAIDLIGSADCDGDANGDGTVDPLDSGYVLSRFGCPVGTGDPGCDAADQNDDGSVDPLDSGYVLARFGPCE